MSMVDFPVPANFADGDKLRSTIQAAGFPDADVYVANNRVIVTNIPTNAAGTISPLVANHVPDIHVPPVPVADRLSTLVDTLTSKGVLSAADADKVKKGGH